MPILLGFSYKNFLIFTLKEKAAYKAAA